MNLPRLSGLLAGLALFASSYSAQAFSLDWSGTYRFSYVTLENPSFDGEHSKSYLLNHLELRPTIIATDELRVTSAFQVLPSAMYPNSKLGQFLGVGSAAGSDTMGYNQDSSQLAVTELYMTWQQQFGALIVGRTPVHFGLGMTHNGGFDPFDHWHNIRDIVGYKIQLGNFFIFPMLGQVKQVDDSGLPGGAAGVSDRMIHVEYESPESGSLFGVFYESRTSDTANNDADLYLPDGQDTDKGRFNSSRVNIVVGREFENLDIMVEGGFYNGDTGVRNSNGDEITINAYGIASEINYRPEGSKLFGGIKLGYASGDDLDEADVYSSYAFHRNYDVATFLLNHPLGQVDAFRTGELRGQPSQKDVDTESISNVMYFSPHITWRWRDTIDIQNRFTYARLNVDPSPANSVDLSAGFEWDIDLIYRPHERVQWITQVGLVFPGSAFEGGDLGLDNEFAYGFATKAAVSF